MSSVPTILGAVKAAIIADAAMRDLVGEKVFAGRAPSGTAPNYIVIGELTGEDLPVFRGGIEQGTERISAWGRDVDAVLDVYSQLRRLLHNQIVALDGFVHISGQLRLVTSFTDPTDRTSQQAVIEYTWITQVGA